MRNNKISESTCSKGIAPVNILEEHILKHIRSEFLNITQTLQGRVHEACVP